ncbi:F420-non-reducing hydrogenase subunit G [uncultured archaeon]|nr:F420-non-reducing hydrogenase subunit G [uncultured archaeon]
MPQKKLAISWVTFACCEDSTIMFVEMLNQHFFEWKELLDFKYCPVLKSKNNDFTGSDVTFVEGAIATKEDEAKLKDIREKSKRIVAIGSCACTGLPSAQRNSFDDEKRKEIMLVVERFGHLEKVHPLKDIVKVDYSVPGCPMDERIFMDTLGKVLAEFQIR